MAQAILIHPIETIQGEIVHHSGVIFRKKHIYDENGKVIHAGKQEIYKVIHPRDFEKKPPKGKEKEHFDQWKVACQRAKEEICPNHPRYEYWQKRWQAQLKHPDAQCPAKHKRSYFQFDCFVRVAILWEVQNAEC